MKTLFGIPHPVTSVYRQHYSMNNNSIYICNMFVTGMRILFTGTTTTVIFFGGNQTRPIQFFEIESNCPGKFV